MDKSEIIATLNQLIETSRDGEQGFRAAARYAKDPNLQILLDTYAEQCLRGTRELELHVKRIGGHSEKTGTIASSIHRGWMRLKASISTDDDHAVLEECERGEDHAKAQYQEALEKQLPPDIAALVRKQLEGLLEHHNRVKALRDQPQVS